jgi:hypothetical protein
MKNIFQKIFPKYYKKKELLVKIKKTRAELEEIENKMRSFAKLKDLFK